MTEPQPTTQYSTTANVPVELHGDVSRSALSIARLIDRAVFPGAELRIDLSVSHVDKHDMLVRIETVTRVKETKVTGT